MLYKTPYSTYRVRAIRRTYRNGNLAIQLIDENDGSPVSTLTVNLGDGLNEVYGEGYAFVDTNNNPTGEQFIKDNKLGTPVGQTQCSGFCEYPLYCFDLNKLEEAKDE